MAGTNEQETRRAERAEERLLGWLVIFRVQMRAQDQLGMHLPFMMPGEVREAMRERSWITMTPIPEAPPDAGAYHMEITDKGMMVSDLAGPEWGVSLMGAPSGTSKKEPET